MHGNGIIFLAENVQAIRRGIKTQTRRALPEGGRSPWQHLQPGNRLWVKEPWLRQIDKPSGRFTGYRYAANEPPSRHRPVRWQHARHMPLLAARIWLIVQAVRIEPVQEISDADCAAEGIEPGELGFGCDGMPHTWAETPREAFQRLWDGIHQHSTWKANPTVAAITFTTEQGET
jgi:hypothetical protein